ncbi:AraC family transcriptional regulator [Petralouisia muris]|uniref:AraC family transcriptional regulator n=1 Tax=Petralouisia muris TaxID=3032872 RepID=A0AC61RNX5_9FIRM|nr:AraC family transcriptional regulator [Petralouisia muris]
MYSFYFHFNSCVIHSTKCTSPNTGIVFQIPFDFIRFYLPDAPQLQFVLDDPSVHPIRQTKIDMFKETLIQMQIANDIRPEGYILRFNSLLFEVLFQLYHNFSVKVFQANLSHKTKDLNRLNNVLSYTNQNEVRLSHIYQDLITTNDTLQNILERHGFTNYKLFRRMFSQRFQGSPSQIRKRLRK